MSRVHRPLISAFKSNSQKHDAVALNHIQEICQWSQDIRFLAGKRNTVADLLSRPSDVPLGTAYQVDPVDAVQQAQTGPDRQHEAGQHESDDEIADFPPVHALSSSLPFTVVDTEKIARAQKACPDVANHKAGKHPGSLHMSSHIFKSGVELYCDIANGIYARPLIPATMRHEIMQIFHSLQHAGSKATLRAIAERYYWPKMGTDIADFVAACVHCNRVKSAKYVSPPLAHKPVIPRRFSDIMLDIIGPLPESNGMRYCLTVVDRTTRFVDAIPLAEATAQNCCDAFVAQWVSRFGLPHTVTTDNGNTFVLYCIVLYFDLLHSVPRYCFSRYLQSVQQVHLYFSNFMAA